MDTEVDMTRKRLLILSMLLLTAFAVMAFSPYENYLLSAGVKRTALIASVKPGQEAAVNAAFKGLAEKKTISALKRIGISNLSSYRKELNGRTWVMVYFNYEGKDYLQAAKDFESAGDSVKALNKLIVPHPRAKRYDTTWLQMEWINYIRGSLSEKETTNTLAMVTTIKPEKEKEYRVLHQSVWPGVVDQMARANNRHFSVFLVEIGETLYEFFHLEYVGTDPKKDEEMNLTDPVNIRWWKHTDACQEPLPGEEGIWSRMEKVE